ncbi:MAG TPA: RIP metalloprotease RseP [Terriglobia bacterium]|nr:RIP metalloprotease RseP [Terriglobia bacterium]
MFSNFTTDIAAVVIVLGVMILIHEFGHFMAAKYFGVRVLTFSLGFGPRLFGVKSGDTDYRVSALPLGGYVKMAGDDPSQERVGDPAEFLSKPRWQRLIIVIMGPTMNVFLAVASLTCLYRYHFEKQAYRDEPVRIGAVKPNSPADKAGVKPGDLIVRLGDLKNPDWEDAEIKIFTTVNEAIPVDIMRDGKEISLSVTPLAEGPDAIGDVGWAPVLPVIVDQVDAQLPAGKGGLKRGDQIVALDGKKINSVNDVSDTTQAANGKPVDFTVKRGGREIHASLTPVFSEVSGEKKWRVGVGLRPVSPIVVRQLPWSAALAESLDFNIKNSLLAFDVLGKVLTRRMSARSFSGPIGIGQMAGEALRSGPTQLIMIMALISMQLAIFNFLPIPVLDGGVMLLLVIEGAMRHDLSLRVKERFVQVGLAILLLLVVVVTYFDLLKTFTPS